MLLKFIRVAIVDNQTLFRKAVKNYLSEQKDIHVVIQASGMFDLLDQLKGTYIDVLVTDLFLHDVSGNDAVELIRSKYPDIKIVILSSCNDLDLISDLLDSGIHGYVSKSNEPEELVDAICQASQNRITHTGILTEALYMNKEKSIKAQGSRDIAILNEREKRILQLLWEEKTNKEIADDLILGIRSVEKIRQDIKEKLGVKSTVGLLKYAIDKKIIDKNRYLRV
jgi:DNA-binding NarL/FixJ family response regulator